jgi:hypothetical protein
MDKRCPNYPYTNLLSIPSALLASDIALPKINNDMQKPRFMSFAKT